MFYIYSKPKCPGCLQAKQLLSKNNKQYVENMLDYGQEKKPGVHYFKVAELEAKLPGAKSVPQIFLDDSHIGGLAELRKYLENLNSTLSH